MSELVSSDNKYIATQQGDGNFVVYRRDGMIPLWDKWSYEAVSNLPPTIPDIPNIPTTPDPPTRPPFINQIAGFPILLAKDVNPMGMSYWRNINYHANDNTLLVLLSISDELILLTVNKSDLSVMDRHDLGIRHTGEGCYFSRLNPNTLFIPNDISLSRYNIITGERIPFWELVNSDNSDSKEVSENHLWQCHSDYAEVIHSGSLQDKNYNIIGWVVYDEFAGEMKRYDLKGDPDECQIDKSGRWLLIKEINYNRIIYIPTGTERIIPNENGALGHSDCGFGLALGENDYSPLPGALDMIQFENGSSKNLYSTGIWNMGYVSFTNARPGALYDQNCLLSTPNELILVKLDDSKRSLKVCDNLTQSQEYSNRPKANLCPLGEYAVWTAFVDGSLNAYIVKVPEF